VRRFSTRQDAASKNPGHVADGRFAPALRVFFGYYLDSRLWRSPFGPAPPFAPQAVQCDKESDPGASAEALQLIYKADPSLC